MQKPPHSVTGRDLALYLTEVPTPGLRPSIACGCLAGVWAVLLALVHYCH